MNFLSGSSKLELSFNGRDVLSGEGKSLVSLGLVHGDVIWVLEDWTAESEEVAGQDEMVGIASCPQSIATPTRDKDTPTRTHPQRGSVTEPLPPGPYLSDACEDGISESSSRAVPCLSRKGEILQSVYRSNPPRNTVEAIFIVLHAELIYKGFEADSNEGRVLTRDFPSVC